MNLDKLTRQEKEKIGVHFLIALGFLALFGIVIAFIGYKNLKFGLLLTGLALSIGSLFAYIIVTGIEQRNYIREIRKPISDRLAELRPVVSKSAEYIYELQNSFPGESSQWSKVGAMNLSSLKRIVDSLTARLDVVEDLINSLSEGKIQDAAALLESPLTFETNLDGHLTDDEMPEMPPNTWIDSIKFLNSEIKKETEKFTAARKKEDFINTLKTS